MNDAMPAAASDAGVPPQGLVGRLIGVLTAPKATFTRLVAAPKVGAALIVLSLLGAAVGPGVFMITEKGTWLDATVQQAERSSGQPMAPEAQARMEKFAPFVGYATLGGTAIFMPIAILIEAGLLYLIFTFGTGGAASFKQVMAVVTYTAGIGVLGLAFTTVMAFVKGAMSTNGASPANLGVLFPMLAENSFLSKFLGLIDFFRIWSIVTVSIGLAVLYKKKTSTVAMLLLAIYAVIIVAVAYFTSSR